MTHWKYDNEQWLAFRHACVTAGIRTIGADFNGSGDEGNIDSLCLPAENEHHRGLQELLDEHGVIDMVYPKSYNYDTKTWTVHAPFTTLHDIQAAHVECNLEDVFYKIIDQYFPGDWVNNEGGYGTVWLDLVTGQFELAGYQRIQTTEPADAAGHFFSASVTATNPVDNTALFVKTILGA